MRTDESPSAIVGRPALGGEAVKISFGQSMAYGVGNIAGTILGYAMSPNLILPVFSIALGVSPALVGMTLAISRAVDFFTDPLAGYLSDTYQQKFGRRAFVAAGSIFGGLAFAGVWLFPTGLSPTANFFWLLAFYCATMIGWSFSSIPYQAWGFEISVDPAQRTKLMGFATALGMLAGVGFGWAYAGTQLPIFGGTIPGARWIGCTMATAVIVTALTSVSFCRTGTKRGPVLAAGGELPIRLGGFMSASRRVLKCRPLLFLTSALFIVNVAQMCLAGVSLYLLIYYICRGDQHLASIIIGTQGMTYTCVALVATPALVWVSNRSGKKKTVLASMGLLWVSSLLPWICTNPNFPWLTLAMCPIAGLGGAAFSTITQSMVADACDVEEVATGVRDSGMFSALYNWMNKLGFSVGLGISGFLVSLSGFDASAAKAPSAHSLFEMKVVLCALPFVAYGCAFALLSRYSITAKMMLTVRAELAQRRALA